MRINSGTLKGRKITFDFIKNPRPTEGMVKEAINSMLRDYYPDKIFLDLFAGSGAVGIEAFSNGCSEVYFIERDNKLAQSLLKNIDYLGVAGKVLFGDYKTNLNFLKRAGKKFDFIFIDPPYQKYSCQTIIEDLINNFLINPNAILIVERNKREPEFESDFLNKHQLVSFKHKKYGNTRLDIFYYQYNL